MILRSSLIACVAVALASGIVMAQAAPPPAMVVLVRHAERAAEPKDDPGLTEAGAARAGALAAALDQAGVTAIITTELRRTRDTAAPLAKARGLTPEIVAARGATAHAEAVAAAVRRHPGGVVLVVGHSNTVPSIIAALGGPKLPDLCDAAYSDLFVLATAGTPEGLAAPGGRLVRSRYGAPDPPGASECR
jgi:phosphohistidine phosphatase SixA